MRTMTIAIVLTLIGAGGGSVLAQEADSSVQPRARRMRVQAERMGEMAPRTRSRQLRVDRSRRGRMWALQRGRAQGIRMRLSVGVGGGAGVGRLLAGRRQLELTEEQVSQLEALKTELGAGREGAQAQLSELRERLGAEWQKDVPDPQEIRRRAQGVAEMEQALRLDALEAAARVRGILTSEQRGMLKGWAQAGGASPRRAVRGSRSSRGVRGRIESRRHSGRTRSSRRPRVRRP